MKGNKGWIAMFTVRVNEQTNGFTAITADELFFINGGSGSTPQLDKVIAQQNSNNQSSSSSQEGKKDSNWSVSHDASVSGGVSQKEGWYVNFNYQFHAEK